MLSTPALPDDLLVHAQLDDIKTLLSMACRSTVGNRQLLEARTMMMACSTPLLGFEPERFIEVRARCT
jgi:hypothetical protein